MSHCRLGLILLLMFVAGSTGSLWAESILTAGFQRWEPDLSGLPRGRAQTAGQTGLYFERIERRAVAQPHLGLRLPFCCATLEASYDYFGGESDLTHIDLDLHDVGVGLGLSADPFKTILHATFGVDLLFLRQHGTFGGGTSGGTTNRTLTANDWGWRLALGATYEPVPRWGVELHWLRRGALQPTVDGLTYDLGGWQFALSMAHFLR
ncbi:MAG: hypothetical protein HN712_16410 [Gemmatimonadetes bacterium]|jgi:hypothetical protein|nr:hypothetical protein [Gemmatimonadota bacterium]MBT6148066.1 hypothetical protein [Gemmatimonadota bacterium]MBT7861899.1 hypothetical protein [Gemmatimonadota bacterium]